MHISLYFVFTCVLLNCAELPHTKTAAPESIVMLHLYLFVRLKMVLKQTRFLLKQSCQAN